MKIKSLLLTGLTVFAMEAGSVAVRGAGTNATMPTPLRIGVYDSRAIAYANFCSEENREKLKKTMDEAKAAKTAGDTNGFAKLKASLVELQAQSHRQVFSTAPVDEILKSMEPRLVEIEKQAGVSRLVSKWDASALGELKSAEQVEVTGLILDEFKLTEKEKQMAKSIESTKPISLEECDRLEKAGKL